MRLHHFASHGFLSVSARPECKIVACNMKVLLRWQASQGVVSWLAASIGDQVQWTS